MRDIPDMPGLRGPGADAHQIRRSVERAFADLDSAKLRAQRSGFDYVTGELTRVLTSLDQVRIATERLRREHTPPEHRRVSELHQAAHDAAHPEAA